MNKFYIQIALFLLNIFPYANNEALATEPAPGEDTKPLSHIATSEEVFEKNKHLLCTNPEETKNAIELMDEAVSHLKLHATDVGNYEPFGQGYESRAFYSKKKDKSNGIILKANLKFEDSNKYNTLINMIWDPDSDNLFNNGSVKIARVYDPNLVIIQQRYKKGFMTRQKYFYALLKKAQISENITIIAMASANINDHNPSGKKYENKIIENANLFTTDIDSEDDIRKGKLRKVFVNIAGYLIENKSRWIDIIYIESIDGYTSL
ncbi:hypothetical protein YYG_05099 [Plasmodium vinckei petteri]|uniref:Fam-a protein n=1 Tax=Plasmodium vinckei petteri TaxID=138298 RepID=W7AD69_PLAVN|nr:hypothetical protein YYG_05099 [Plasmodium vinckei petteri]CAD2110684.1 fam-a protein [Plasmodium vinckei petteri]